MLSWHTAGWYSGGLAEYRVVPRRWCSNVPCDMAMLGDMLHTRLGEGFVPADSPDSILQRTGCRLYVRKGAAGSCACKL